MEEKEKVASIARGKIMKDVNKVCERCTNNAEILRLDHFSSTFQLIDCQIDRRKILNTKKLADNNRYNS